MNTQVWSTIFGQKYIAILGRRYSKKKNNSDARIKSKFNNFAQQLL